MNNIDESGEKMKKTIFFICILLLFVLVGCTETKYVCPNGKTTSDPNSCRWCGDGICSDGEDYCVCEEDCQKGHIVQKCPGERPVWDSNILCCVAV